MRKAIKLETWWIFSNWQERRERRGDFLSPALMQANQQMLCRLAPDNKWVHVYLSVFFFWRSGVNAVGWKQKKSSVFHQGHPRTGEMREAEFIGTLKGITGGVKMRARVFACYPFYSSLTHIHTHAHTGTHIQLPGVKHDRRAIIHNRDISLCHLWHYLARTAGEIYISIDARQEKTLTMNHWVI